ncbi:MAG: CbtA family protein [Rhodospirillales bacterium]|nr:CbtA family protein [Rhodospirillales bacterium]
MFRGILLSAIMAGLLAGLFISLVQEFTTTPIILQAETYEISAAPDHYATDQPEAKPAEHDHGQHDQGGDWSPGDGFERTAYTALGNIILAVGFGLILIACFALQGGEINGRRGVIWGLAGYAVFSLAPALGLPPETPGSMVAELVARQEWWFLAAGATALGLALMVFGKGIPWIVLGIIILAAPHIIGAPQPAEIGAKFPPEIAGHFAAASLVTAAIFWAVLGWLGGTFYRRASINP